VGARSCPNAEGDAAIVGLLPHGRGCDEACSFASVQALQITKGVKREFAAEVRPRPEALELRRTWDDACEARSRKRI
jgi:hypothetical protein